MCGSPFLYVSPLPFASVAIGFTPLHNPTLNGDNAGGAGALGGRARLPPNVADPFLVPTYSRHLLPDYNKTRGTASMSQKRRAQKLRGRKDHWLPQGYMRGFIGPSRSEEHKPLWCYDRYEGKWKTVASSEIGQGVGFYDYANGTDYSAVTHPDSVFARLEREFPLVRDELAANRFENWEVRKDFLLEFMQMLRARSPLAIQQHQAEGRKVRASMVTSVDAEQRKVTLDSLVPRPLPESKVRNWAIHKMLEDVKAGASWSNRMHWCLRYTANESDPFCTTDQSPVARGPAPGPAPGEVVSFELLAHPETLVLFPLSWQACMLGSPRPFEKEYDVAAPQLLESYRTEQKEKCNRFVISPIRF